MKTIFHILLYVTMSLMTTLVSAQDMSSLEEFYKKLSNGCFSFSCQYTLQPSGSGNAASFGNIMGEARVEMQGHAYIFRGNGLAIISDGKSICVMDESAEEAVYEALPESFTETDYLQNPAYLIRGLEDNFKVLSSTRVKDARGGYVSDNYVLVPTVQCGICKCYLDFVAHKGILSAAEFELSDGNVLKVKFSEQKFLPEKPMEYFALMNPSSFESSWIITDLR